MRRTFALPDERSIIETTEVVASPREQAWVARFEPLYVAQWSMPMGYSNPIVEVDLVEGGRWRLVQRDPEGNEFAFYGQFLTVEPSERTVQTFVSELFPEVTSHVTTEFADHSRGTRIVTTHAFAEERERRGFVRMGGVERMAEASILYDRLLHKLAGTR
jgi:uncharacterized protein YndB with AHSA1/START domain